MLMQSPEMFPGRRRRRGNDGEWGLGYVGSRSGTGLAQVWHTVHHPVERRSQAGVFRGGPDSDPKVIGRQAFEVETGAREYSLGHDQVSPYALGGMRGGKSKQQKVGC